MTTYYIKPSSEGGNDANSGTSIANAWATPTKALSTLSAGDICYMLAGTYFILSNTSPSNSGTAGNRITLRNYQDEVPVIEVSGQIRFQDGGKNYWTFDGLSFKDLPFGAGCCIRIGVSTGASNRSYGVTVQNCKFYDMADTVIQPTNGEDITVTNCLFDTVNTGQFGTGANGLYVVNYAHNLVVEDCAFFDMYSDGLQLGGSGANTVFTTEIRRCTFWQRNPLYFSSGENGIDLKTVNGPVTIEDCLFVGWFYSEPNEEGMGGGGGVAITIHNDAQNIVISRCRFEFCVKGIILSNNQGNTRNVTVEDCYFNRIRHQDASAYRVSATSYALQVTSATVGIVIRNNTFFDCDDYMIYFNGTTAGDLYGNVFASNAGFLFSGGETWDTSLGNTYYTDYITAPGTLNDPSDTDIAGQFPSPSTILADAGTAVASSAKLNLSYASVQVSLNTSTGNQLITVGGLTETPFAAIFSMTPDTQNDVVSVGAVHGMGFTDGTNQAAYSYYAISGDSARKGWTDRCITCYDTAGVVDFEASIVGFGAGSCTINIINAPTSQYLLNVTLLCGSDGAAEVKIVNPGGVQDVENDITTFSQKYDAFIFLSQGFGPFSDPSNHSGTSVGFAAVQNRAVTQYNTVWRSPNVEPNLPVGIVVEHGSVGGKLNSLNQLVWKAELRDVDDQGFTLVPRDENASHELAVLALSVGEDNVRCLLQRGPKDTGNRTTNNLPFEPRLVIEVVSNMKTAHNIIQNQNSDSIGLAVATDNAQYFNGTSVQNNATNRGSITDSRQYHGLDDGTSDNFVGDFSGFNPDGWTTSVSAANEPDEPYWPCLVFYGQDISTGVTVDCAEITDAVEDLLLANSRLISALTGGFATSSLVRNQLKAARRVEEIKAYLRQVCP